MIDQDVTEKRLGSIATASFNLSSIACTLNQIVCMMGTLQVNVCVLKSTNNHLATTCAAQESELIQSRQQVVVLTESDSKLALFQQKFQSLKAVVFSMVAPSPSPPFKRSCVDVPGTSSGACRESLLLEDTAASNGVIRIGHGLGS